jgi:UPF0716 protein FxsA
MFLALLLLIIWPVAEVYVAIKIAEAIGVVAMLLLLVAGWPLGSWALRSQGGAAWRRLADALAERRAPGREVLDGVLILLGGILLIIPGFITDALGVVLMLPPARALLRGALGRSLLSRLTVRAARSGPGARSYDVDSTATDLEQPRLQP